MSIKKVLLVIMMFFLCGCTCEYNLTIEGSTYKEEFSLQQGSNDQTDKNYLNTLYLEEYPIFYSQEFLYYSPNTKLEGNTYFDKSITTVNDLVRASYKAEFDNDSYNDSRVLKTSFKDIQIGYNASRKYYYIELSGLKIFNADNEISKINVNINVDENFVVIKNNAKDVVGNSYRWEFNNENAKLELRYMTKANYEANKNNSSENNKPPVEKVENKEDYTTSIIIVIIGFVSFLVVLVIIIKNKNKLKYIN